MEPSLSDLVLLHLSSLPAFSGGEDAPHDRTVSGICEPVGRNPDAHSLSVLSTLEALVEAGDLEERVSRVEGSDGERSVYVLTESGRERAASLRADYADESVILRTDGTEREVTLGEIDEHLDVDAPLVTALVEMEDGVLRRGAAEGDPFVGRKRELSILEDVVWRSGMAPWGAVLVGPTGIGKTTLATEFATRVREEGGRVLTAVGDRDTTEPFGLFRALFESLEDSPFASAQEIAVDADSYEEQRQSLFSNVLDQLEALADQRPTLIVLDDVEWATPASLDLLVHLADRLEDPSLRLVCCYNTDSAADERVAAAVDRVTDGPLERLDLEPLSRADVGTLVAALLGSDPPEAFVDGIYEQTQGSPLFVTELVQHLQENDAVDPATDTYPTTEAETALPDTATAVIEERLASLDDSHRAILEAAAVAGERVSLPVLEEMTGRSESALRETATAFVDADLWERASAADVPLSRTFRFGSAIVRETVLEDIDADRRATLHERAARAILDVGLTDPQVTHATVARHYEQAGQVGDAIEQYLTAADHAMDLFAHEAAIEHCERALELAESTDTDDVLAVQERLVEIHRTSGEYDEAARYLDAARERTAEADVARRQRVARFAASLCNAQGEYETAIEEATDGLALSEEASEERCRLLEEKARAEIERGEYDEAADTAGGLHALAERIDSPAVRARGTRLLGEVAHQQGDYEAARDSFERALGEFERADDRYRVAEVQKNLGNTAWRLNDYERASTHLERALEGYEAVGDRHGIAEVRADLGTVAHKQGDYEQAWEDYQDALAEFQRLGDSHSIASVYNLLAAVASVQGFYGQAEEYYQEALERYRDAGDRHGVAKVRNNLGSASHRQGEYETAREHSREALERYQDIGDRLGVAVARTNLTMVAADRGAYERADALAAQVLETFEELDDPRTGVLHLTRGKAARGQGADERAREHLETALDRLREEGDDSRLVQTRTELGILARQRGDDGAAREHLEQALERASGVETSHPATRCHCELAALAIEEGDSEEATRHLQEAEEGYTAFDDRHGVAVVRVRRALLARDRGEDGTAREHLQDALSTFEDVGSRHWAARTRHLLGAIAADDGDRTTAREYWEAAAETLTDIGAVPDAIETLERLVDCCVAGEDPASARVWCDRALAVLADADGFDDERTWFEDRQEALADRGDTA